MTTLVFSPVTYDDRPLLEMVQQMARNVGLPVPSEVCTSTERTWVEALDYANRVGNELHTRADWGGLVNLATITGDGTAAAIALPDDFARLAQGVTVTASGATVRPLTRAEWNTLADTEGTPRYFLLEGKTLHLWPYLATGETVSVSYVSTDWNDSGHTLAGDSDKTVYPPELFTRGLIVYWRRQKGMDYADFEAEFEAMLANYAAFDDRSRL